LGEYIRLQIGLLSINISKLDLIILDEPGNFIDIFTQQALIKILNEFKGGVLMVTHDEILGSNLGFTKKFILD
jgi:ATPase subunit of ABC transporter with duplicated ATPase domains